MRRLDPDIGVEHPPIHRIRRQSRQGMFCRHPTHDLAHIGETIGDRDVRLGVEEIHRRYSVAWTGAGYAVTATTTNIVSAPIGRKKTEGWILDCSQVAFRNRLEIGFPCICEIGGAVPYFRSPVNHWCSIGDRSDHQLDGDMIDLAAKAAHPRTNQQVTLARASARVAWLSELGDEFERSLECR